MHEGVADLVRAASEGNQPAWDRLVDLYSGLIWSIARGHGLSHSDAADVSQTTWLRLVEHLGRIRQPERLGGWLASTARHECLRVLRRSAWQTPLGGEADLDALAPGHAVTSSGEEVLLAVERDAALWRALGELSPRCRLLIRVLLAEPRPSYEAVAEALDMPVGSIGPTRARCLDRLRQNAELAGVATEAESTIPASRRPEP
jgi:RNA polymerase sigma factor (sigma-70 family)